MPIKTFKGENDRDWYWKLVGFNGETLAISEAFTRKADARRAANGAIAVVLREIEMQISEGKSKLT